MPEAPSWTAKEDTQNGTVYYYSHDKAKLPLMNSANRLQHALAQSEGASGAGAKIRMNAQSHPDQVVVVTAAGVAAGVTAVAGAVGAIGTVAAAAGTAAQAGIGLASLLGVGQPSKKETIIQSAEITIHNNTLTPIILYNYKNNALTSVSGVKPLLPGASDTMVVASHAGGFTSGKSWVELKLFVGGGAIDSNGQLIELHPIEAVVEYSCTTNNSWAPTFHIDNSEDTFENKEQGVSAAYFMANSNSKAVDFTVAAYTVESSNPSLDVVFMPGSSKLTG